jgi:hypothetical protein
MPILILMTRRRYGSWGCCFTYGCWFGIHGLVLSGEPVDSPSIRSAVQFLRSHQNANGGWGEDFSSCYDKDYAPSGARRYGVGGSSVVQTSWALLALLEAGVSRPFPSWNRSILTEIYLCHACSCQEVLRTETAGQCGAAGRDPDLEEGEVLALQRGCRFLVSRQRPAGDWPQEGIAGKLSSGPAAAAAAPHNEAPWSRFPSAPASGLGPRRLNVRGGASLPPSALPRRCALTLWPSRLARRCLQPQLWHQLHAVSEYLPDLGTGDVCAADTAARLETYVFCVGSNTNTTQSHRTASSFRFSLRCCELEARTSLDRIDPAPFAFAVDVSTNAPPPAHLVVQQPGVA